MSATTVKKHRWFCSRRAFLGGLGAAGFSHLLPGAAQAQGRKRFVVVYVPEGMWAGADRPAAGATTLGSIFGPMDPYRTKVTALDGFDIATAAADRPGVDEHHRLPHLLSSTKMVDGRTSGAPTIDQRIAKVVGGQSTFESLQFGVQIVYKDGSGRLIWKDRAEQLPAMEDPWAAYDRIFGNRMGPAMPPPGQPGQPAVPPKFDLRKSALDYSLGEIASIQPRLAATDKARVDSYQTSLRDIEKRLQAVQGPAGPTGPVQGAPPPGSCTPPSVGAPMDVKAKPNFPMVAKLQIDLLVTSLQCGITNVASLQFGNSVDQCTYPWLGVRRTGHDLSHGGSRAEQPKVYRWYAEQFAYLLGKLQAVPEAGGTMLDNTVVMWVSEFGNSSSHSLRNVLWFLAGNVGGFLKQGQVIKSPGRSVSDLHVTVLNAFGIPDKTFGEAAHCTGPIAGLIA